MRIGVLALQGAFHLHKSHIEAAGAEYVEVVNTSYFEKIDGLILPGGESATILKLIEIVGIEESLSDFLKTKPVWGICAGAILMAKKVQNPEQKCYGILDIEIERNSYGRQLESTEQMLDNYLVSYIRAPKIISTGNNVKVLAQRNGFPSWVEERNLMATTFHPEINHNMPSPWHKKFVKMCGQRKALLTALEQHVLIGAYDSTKTTGPTVRSSGCD